MSEPCTICGATGTLAAMIEQARADARREALEQAIAILLGEAKEWHIGGASFTTKEYAVGALDTATDRLRALLDAHDERDRLRAEVDRLTHALIRISDASTLRDAITIARDALGGGK